MKERGWVVRFRVSGLGCEKLLNEARKRGLALQKVRRQKDRALFIRCAPEVYRAFSALAQEKGFVISEPEPAGLFCFVRHLIGRWGVLLGGAACTVLLVLALQRVWIIRIQNAGPNLGEVRACLEEMGIQPGIKRKDAAVTGLREKLEWRLPRVKWVRTECRGVTLIISLEEGTPPPVGETYGAPGDVVAAEDGFLIRLTTYAGTPEAKEGSFVKAGQVLIKGIEKRENAAYVPVKARGEAIARTWQVARVRMPLTEVVSVPTGREETIRRLETPFYSWASQILPAYAQWDQERKRLPVGGVWAPIVLERNRIMEVDTEKKQRNREEVKEEAKKAALQALNRAISGQEVVDKWINFRMIEGDTIVVEATGEIRRDIGRYQKN